MQRKVSTAGAGDRIVESDRGGNDKIGERWELGCDKKGFSDSKRRRLGAKPDRVLITESGKSLIPRLGNS